MAKNKSKTYSIQQAVIPDYREPVYRLLRDELGDSFNVVAGDVDFSKTIKTVPSAVDLQDKVENYYFFGRRLLWQSGAFKKLCDADVVVLSYNLRIISNLFIVWCRRLSGKSTYLWGHVEGKSSLTRRFGWLYTYFGTGFIAYTESQAAVIAKRCPKLPVFVAANACFHAESCYSEPNNDYNDIIFLGRLVAGKKPCLLLEAFILAVKKNAIPESVKLIYVGDGPLLGKLQKRVQEIGMDQRVEFKGHVNEISKLRTIFSSALLCVSPGYVGLSVTQSFAFGVPVLMANDEPHSPEVEACIEGWNTISFESDQPSDLSAKLTSLYDGEITGIVRGGELSEWTMQRYSFEKMADSFMQCFEGEIS